MVHAWYFVLWLCSDGRLATPWHSMQTWLTVLRVNNRGFVEPCGV
jgi:hypothetical protein